MQSAHHILMIRPASFGFNTETAASNAFQQKPSLQKLDLSTHAKNEFDNAVKKLSDAGIHVIVEEDSLLPAKTDAVFPNNWVSFHSDGKVIMYPMEAESRRKERRLDIIEKLRSRYNISEVIDLSYFENENRFLEGTGSVIFDHKNRIAYAALSSRTHKEVLLHLCGIISYKPLFFIAADENGKPIYHTNVMMCIAERFAVICLDCIIDEKDKNKVKQKLETTGHVIVDISFSQVKNFAGNMLAVLNESGDTKLIMSGSAYNSLKPGQKKILESFAELVPVSIPFIETTGGGSARCMIAEIFLPLKTS